MYGDMLKPYSNDLRERVVGAVAAGQSCRAVAQTFGVSVASVVKWSQRHRRTGSIAPDKIGGHKPLKLESERGWILSRLAEQPDLSVRALADELAARGIVAGHVAVWNLLRSENLSHKKSLFASEQSRPDIAHKRARWGGIKDGSIPRASFSSTKPGPRRTWHPHADGQREAAALLIGYRMASGRH